MQIPCPICGPRDIREFTPKGHASYLDRPGEDAAPEAWLDYLHLRDNPAGDTRELWYHGAGCGAWLVVDRNTVTHEVRAATLAREVRDAG
jgi:sarcosine oxidase subunit delta